VAISGWIGPKMPTHYIAKANPEKLGSGAPTSSETICENAVALPCPMAARRVQVESKKGDWQRYGMDHEWVMGYDPLTDPLVEPVKVRSEAAP
jgi:hypothetical protein